MGTTFLIKPIVEPTVAALRNRLVGDITNMSLFEEESMKVGMSRKAALFPSMWIVGINQIAIWVRYIWPPSPVQDTTRFQTLVFLFLSPSRLQLLADQLVDRLISSSLMLQPKQQPSNVKLHITVMNTLFRKRASSAASFTTRIAEVNGASGGIFDEQSTTGTRESFDATYLLKVREMGCVYL